MIGWLVGCDCFGRGDPHGGRGIGHSRSTDRSTTCAGDISASAAEDNRSTQQDMPSTVGSEAELTPFTAASRSTALVRGSVTAMIRKSVNVVKTVGRLSAAVSGASPFELRTAAVARAKRLPRWMLARAVVVYGALWQYLPTYSPTYLPTSHLSCVRHAGY